MPNWENWNSQSKECFEFARKLIHEATLIYLLLHHWQMPGELIKPAGPSQVQESAIRPPFRGWVRTVDGAALASATIRFVHNPSARRLTVFTNDAGYFEIGCPEPGEYSIQVDDGAPAPAKTIRLIDCSRPHKIVVRRAPVKSMEFKAMIRNPR